MAVYANIPWYFSVTTSNSGVVNIFGSIVQEPVPGNFIAPLPEVIIKKDIPIYYDISYLSSNYDDQFIVLYREKPVQPLKDPIYYDLGYLSSNYDDQFIVLYREKPVQPLKDPVVFTNYEPITYYPTFKTTCTGICRAPLQFNYIPYVKIDYALVQIYTNDQFIFSADAVGVTVYDVEDVQEICTIKIKDSYITAIAGNNSYLYIGTKTGLYITDINNPCNSEPKLQELNLTNTNIKYLHCYNNYLGVCTFSGVDYFRFNTNPEIHSKSFISGSKKCFILPNTLYYTTSQSGIVNSKVGDSLNKINSCLTDWTQPDDIYTTGSGIFKEGIKLTDLYITEATAKEKGNTIFCTTTSGAYIIDEDTKEYAIYYTRD